MYASNDEYVIGSCWDTVHVCARSVHVCMDGMCYICVYMMCVVPV
jgi:hypothetical protein